MAALQQFRTLFAGLQKKLDQDQRMEYTFS